MNVGNSPCAIIHLDNIESNFDLVRSCAPESQTMVVVKADAYGHGVAEVCRRLCDADAFAVARVSEGIDLREAGLQHPICILEGFLDEAEQDACLEHGLIPTIHSLYQLRQLDDQLPAWLKVNSGMHRLGFGIKEIEALVELIKEKSFIGVMSHLANADKAEYESNKAQLSRFREIVAKLDPALALSIANSGGILNIPESHFEWVRPGIMLYGGSPSPRSDKRLKAGMTLTAPVISINELQAGDAIGYGSLWTAKQPCRVSVVGLGYADGYPREMPEGTAVLINHQRRELIGRISMDMTFVKIEDTDEVSPGDRVTFWGEELPVDEIANRIGTISYALMSGLTPRVKRVYEN